MSACVHLLSLMEMLVGTPSVHCSVYGAAWRLTPQLLITSPSALKTSACT